MSDSENSANSIDFKRSRPERIAPRQPSNPSTKEDKKRKRKQKLSANKKLKAQSRSRTVSDTSDGSGQDQRAVEATSLADAVHTIDETGDTEAIEEIFEDPLKALEKEKEQESSQIIAKDATMPGSGETAEGMSGSQIVAALQALTGSVNKLLEWQKTSMVQSNMASIATPGTSATQSSIPAPVVSTTINSTAHLTATQTVTSTASKQQASQAGQILRPTTDIVKSVQANASRIEQPKLKPDAKTADIRTCALICGRSRPQLKTRYRRSSTTARQDG